LAASMGAVALITGASRGVGAAAALLLAGRGYDIIVNYHSKRPRAEEVAAAIRGLGRRALLAQADLTNEADVAAMIDSVGREFGRLDVLILNASGGLEKGKPAEYAMQLNLTAQVRLVDLSLKLMPRGGRIVFVTSHMAHFYGERGMVGPYEPVAASKHAGETALRERRREFESLGILLTVVSGDMIAGTITPRLLERMQRGTSQARRDQVGALPTVAEFAGIIADAASDAKSTGETRFVGSTVPDAAP
jgi:NAD(P)-dependent dehydrogenase (short-subunit alcohol dehydrogenase family)